MKIGDLILFGGGAGIGSWAYKCPEVSYLDGLADGQKLEEVEQGSLYLRPDDQY